MKPSELRELIAGGENSGLEFKRDDLRPEQLARDVVALANLQGGRILLGVEDDGTIPRRCGTTAIPMRAAWGCGTRSSR